MKQANSDYAKAFASLGGVARAKKLSEEQRAEIARKASVARWGSDRLKMSNPNKVSKEKRETKKRQ